MDNNDFKIHTLTGNAAGAHQTNVLYVQPKSYEEESDNDSQQLKVSPRRKCQNNWMWMWSTKNSQMCDNEYVSEEMVLTHQWGTQLLSWREGNIHKELDQ